MKKTIYIAAVTIFALSCKEKEADKTVIEDVVSVNESVMKMPNEEVILFDGSDFDAWKGYGVDGVHENWKIEDGVMVFIPGKEGGKNIITRDVYKNFVLSLDWKISEGGNSGIFWGVHESPEFSEAYETGPEIQVLDDERHPDAKFENGTHNAGSLYDMIKPAHGMIHPAGEWNNVVLTIDHNKNEGKVELNGNEAYTFPVNGEKWEAMVAQSKFADWKGFGKYPEGHIGLQDHGDKVWYRNITIQKIN